MTATQCDIARKLGWVATTATLTLFLLAAPASAAKLYVENWGLDTPPSPPCGAKAKPCRSIGKAVSLAVPGDTVFVGPGRYSNDLDGDSVFNEPGEEPATGLVLPAITLKSTHGSAVTRIEYGGNFSAFAAIQGSGTTFGTRNHGFTVVFQQTVLNTLRALYVDNAGIVAGNVFFVASPGAGIDALTATGGAVARDNRIIAATATSIYDGIVSTTLAERNSVVGALYGVVGSGKLRRNVAIENSYGFRLDGTVTEFTSSMAVANSVATGILVSPGTVLTAPIKTSIIAGNGGGPNCGLYNDSGTAITATKNFWGASTGPGADPADLACNGVGSSTTTTPFQAMPTAPPLGALQ